MPTLVQTLGLQSNPFEHYIAETEPHIAEYAVKPPYLTAMLARAKTTTSFILFGDRGAGKSATRLTLYRELWEAKSTDNTTKSSVPLAVNYIDFSKAIKGFRAGNFSDSDFIVEVAFLTIESILAWLASLTEDEREIYTEALETHEKVIIVALIKQFYLSRSETERKQTEREALTLLNQAWTTRSVIWASKRWDVLSELISRIIDIAAKRFVSESADVAKSADDVLKSLVGSQGEVGRPVLQKLVEFVRVFGFSGIVVLIDKVDETEFTQNSAESTTRLVYPLLSHIQLLEVEGFGWQLFLWSQVKPFMESEKFRVRLDKIASATIDWDNAFFRQMLDERIKYYSGGKLSFSSLFDGDSQTQEVIEELVSTAMRSPRELVRVMDTIITEHDIVYGEQQEAHLLTKDSIRLGQDRYVKERIGSVYDERMLNQVYRVGSLKFVNIDIQAKFRINSQSARNKIKSWEDAGIIKQTGTRAAEGELGGKPSYEYSIVDARVARIIRNKLITIDDIDTEDSNVE